MRIEMSIMELEGRSALVTGATSGIGRETAVRLARAGAEVIVSGRNAERGAETVAAIEAHGVKARFVAVDLADLDSVGHLAEEAADVDILVNNAGIYEFLPTTEQDVASFDAMFGVNVRAPYFLTKAIAPKMAARGEGSIVNVSTMVAELGMPTASVYSATKAALASLTRTWVAEFSPSGVRVNTVGVGPTLTEGTGAEMSEAVGSTTPMNRYADVKEIGEVIVFLASPRASYVTGANVAVDGGRTAV
jgi:NAD(P)-dependent dehydrogenase (short-subunit alcohol dehydrogenase family)